MNKDAEITHLQAENEVLRKVIVERSAALHEVLGALSGMWNQYCPPRWTHMFMSAGEGAEEVLIKWQLMRPDESSIYIAGAVTDKDVPNKVTDLLTNPITQESHPQAENKALRNLLVERSADLHEGLGSLSDMWNQYCVPPYHSMFEGASEDSSAGKDAERVLNRWQLIRPDKTSIYIAGMVIDDDMPDGVIDLLLNPLAQAE